MESCRGCGNIRTCISRRKIQTSLITTNEQQVVPGKLLEKKIKTRTTKYPDLEATKSSFVITKYNHDYYASNVGFFFRVYIYVRISGPISSVILFLSLTALRFCRSLLRPVFLRRIVLSFFSPSSFADEGLRPKTFRVSSFNHYSST